MKRRKVLIVDDLPQARDGLHVLLDTFPQIEIVGEAADGQEAVRLVQAFQPDVVLMDVHMPRMNGLDATQMIKALRPETVVIVLTVHSNHEIEAFAAGADAFFRKGVQAEELVEAICSL
jgi:DNA-binding NarL/FixJ family response regulator